MTKHLATSLALFALAATHLALAAEPTRPACDPDPALSTSFSVKASRFGLSTRRQVVACARLEGLSGRIGVDLDRPIKTRFGVEELAIAVQVIDDEQRVVATLRAALHDGDEQVEIAFDLPRPGRYRFVIDEEGLDAGPARLAIQPAGEASLELVALDPALLGPLRVLPVAASMTAPPSTP